MAEELKLVEDIPTTEAIKQGILGLPESGQQFFATVAAAETRRIKTKKVAQENFREAVPFEAILEVILRIGIDPDETIMLENEATELLKTSLVDQLNAQFPLVHQLAEEEGAAVAIAESEIGEI